MKGINQIVSQMEEKISSYLMIAIIVLVFVAALMRWFGWPLSWSVDMAQLFFVWACFLGADRALRVDRHIGVDSIVRLFPQEARETITLINYVLIVIFLAFVAIYGIRLSAENYLRQFNGMALSYSWATMSAPVGCGLMMTTIIGKIINLLQGESRATGEQDGVPQL